LLTKFTESYKDLVFVVLVIFFVTLVLYLIPSSQVYSQQNQNIKNASAAVDANYPESALPSAKGPIITDPNLKAEVVFSGLTYPTGMEFLDKDDVLVIEKNTGIVRRIVNNVMEQDPLLDVNVASFGHRGLLGIAVSKLSSHSDQKINKPTDIFINKDNKTRYVFLYYTAAATRDGDDVTEGKQPLGNFVYRYEFINNKLINPKLLLKLPATPGAIGIGGKILVGPDNNLYVTIGGLGLGISGHFTKAQNVQNGKDPDGTSGILVIDQNGNMTKSEGILGNKHPLNKYYAYGMWNSFGIDFDPITQKLWDTENGVIFGDEINLVEPGFNRGWNKIDGIWLRGYPIEKTESQIAPIQEEDLLVNINGKGKYSLPEFTWFTDVGPTAIKFFNSSTLGKQYENDVFVGDIINGNLYHFKLDKQRTGLLLSSEGPLVDKVVSSNDKLDEIIFGIGFGGITDIKVGSEDGYLYILTFNKSQGMIYRIVPKNTPTYPITK
jgi:aldose sugar dehydrogenase